MHLGNRIKTFSLLGLNLESFIKNYYDDCLTPAQEEIAQTLKLAEIKNPWFTIENQLYALSEWAEALKKENLEKWLSKYDLSIKNKNVGIVAAGNIPLVGFHDLLSVVLSGNNAIIKLSSNDEVLMKYMIHYLYDIAPEFKEIIKITDKLKGYDAVIATGSDNTARYFESYFKDIPHIIRKNRTSVAILTGEETPQDLENLSNDMLRYFGLGCRNVTKIYTPKGYDLNTIFNSLFKWKDIINHHKYANNYDYYRTIYLMKQIPITENGFVLMTEDKNLFSPISVIFHEEYDNLITLIPQLKNLEEKIQCIVNKYVIPNLNTINFGEAQSPKLWDYADGIDTINWLNNLNS
ncbi:acyl-CoA reductase [Weeksellaceae bacterium TAE3-ERU29]|nr:acyl-CoA reductase [Weeksellaceae bacterium TAE3-ERU29]